MYLNDIAQLSGYNAELVDKEVAVLSFYYSLGRKSRNIQMSNSYTVDELEKLDFKFSDITKEYLVY